MFTYMVNPVLNCMSSYCQRLYDRVYTSLPLLEQPFHLVAKQGGFRSTRALGDDLRKGEESRRRVDILMRALEITSDQIVKGSYGDIIAAS